MLIHKVRHTEHVLHENTSLTSCRGNMNRPERHEYTGTKHYASIRSEVNTQSIYTQKTSVKKLETALAPLKAVTSLLKIEGSFEKSLPSQYRSYAPG